MYVPMDVSYLIPKLMSKIFTVEFNKLWVLTLIFNVADFTFFYVPRVSRVIILCHLIPFRRFLKFTTSDKDSSPLTFHVTCHAAVKTCLLFLLLHGSHLKS
jgi:hypothetical protein